MPYQFTKMHGTGNDFVVFDTFSRSLQLTAQQIQRLADRRYGVGCDQVLLLAPPKSKDSDVYYRIFNADGNEVMQCGNGARCVALYLNQKGLVNKTKLIATTATGQLTLAIDKDTVTVDMGIPIFEPAQIPMRVDHYAKRYQLDVLDHHISYAALSLGNPHAVIKVADVASAPVQQLGAALQQHPRFPEQVNVGFMEIIDDKTFKLRVYERGVGETLSCGSGASAAMVAACNLGYLRGAATAKLPGGELTLSWAGSGSPVYLTGTATIVFDGNIAL